MPRHRKVTEEKEKQQQENNNNEPELFEMLGLEEIKNEEIDDNTTEKKWGAAILTTDSKLLQEIKDGYKEDETLYEIISLLRKQRKQPDFKVPKDMVFKISNYRWDRKEKLLYRKIVDTERLCIPNTGVLRVNRLLEAHDIPLGGHFGREKTLANLARNFFWSGMTKDVEDFVKSCSNCQRNKTVKRAPIGLLYPHDAMGKNSEFRIALDL